MSVTKLKKEKTNICLKLTSNLCKRVYMALGTESDFCSREWEVDGQRNAENSSAQRATILLLFCSEKFNLKIRFIRVMKT